MKKIGIFAVLVLCLASMAFAAGGAQQGSVDELGNFPARPIQVITPSAAGGGNDAVARTVQKHIQTRQPLAVLNVPGANNLLGAMQFHNSPADGYTLLAWETTPLVLMHLSGRSDVEFYKEFEPIAALVADHTLFAAGRASGFRSIDDLVAAARARPGTVRIGTVGVRSNTDTAIRATMNHYGIWDLITHVPYDNGTQGATALLGNHVEAFCASIMDMRGGLDSGDFTPMMIFSRERSRAMPHIPTSRELGIPYSNMSRRTFFAPAGTPEVRIRYFEAELRALFDNPEFISDIEGLAVEADFRGRDDMEALISDSYQTFAPFFRD